MTTDNEPGEALKACPFCGSEAFISFDGDIGVPDDWSANCKNTLPCGATVQGISSEKDARKAWNRRASVAAVVPRNVQAEGDIAHAAALSNRGRHAEAFNVLVHALRAAASSPKPAQHQPATPVVARELYSELINIAAALAKGEGFISPCFEDHSGRTPKAIVFAAQRQEDAMKDWAYRIRQVANKISAATTPPSETAVGGEAHAQNPNAFCLVCNEHPCKLIAAPVHAAGDDEGGN